MEPSSGQDNTTLDAEAWQRWQAGYASAIEIERWQQQLREHLSSRKSCWIVAVARRPVAQPKPVVPRKQRD